MAEERTVGLRIRWVGPNPGNRPDAFLRLTDHGASARATTEFGMQRGRWELVPGRPDGDDLMFETEVMLYRDKAGRPRFRGPEVQGKPEEPFLYLSWRVKGEQSWIMRAKVDLSPLTEGFLSGVAEGVILETVITKLGGRDRGQLLEWRAI